MSDDQQVKQVPATSKRGKRQQRATNPWMWAFIVLVGLMIGAGGATVYQLTRPVNTTTTVKAPNRDGSVMRVDLTKREVNRVIDNYLSHYLTQDDVKYSLVIGNHAVLKGQFKFFGQSVEFGIQCDPYVLTNGNVKLKATKMTVGALAVPIDYVLSYAGKNFNFPDWVQVNSQDRSIVLALNQFDLGNGLHVRADRIDLVHDRINLTGYLAK